MTFTYSFEAIGSRLFSFRVRQHIHILGRQLKASQSLSVQKQLKKMTHPQNAKENCHCFPTRMCACIIPASRAGWSQWLQGSKAGKTPTWGNSRQGPACLSCACSCFPLLRLPLTCSPCQETTCCWGNWIRSLLSCEKYICLSNSRGGCQQTYL